MRRRIPRADEKIAVAIPTRNRPGYLASLLASLSQQTYRHWSLVVNDQSDPPARESDAVRDLLQLIRQEHEVTEIFSETGWDRHQRCMQAVPDGVEWIVRVDDDVLLSPTFLEKLMRPWRLLPGKDLAAVGGCYPEPQRRPVDLDVQLTDASRVPRFDRPTWKLQGFQYDTEPEILEVESLFGPAICYRREAIERIGGWAVEGFSDQAHREESDACARLFLAGYEILVTTEAIAWHLYAPGGGARTVRKTDHGSFLASDPAPIEADEVLFQSRLAKLEAETPSVRRDLRRYRIADLERQRRRPRPLSTLWGRMLAGLERRVLRRVRKAVRYVLR